MNEWKAKRFGVGDLLQRTDTGTLHVIFHVDHGNTSPTYHVVPGIHFVTSNVGAIYNSFYDYSHIANVMKRIVKVSKK